MASDQAHVPVSINGIRVYFPFEPYDVQKDYMKSTIQAIQQAKNALLESPTGTGKTLSLVCSTLAWLSAQGQGHSMVYYTSRTHKQLDQAAKEMKRTAYARNPSVVIGSRAQLCINNEVRDSKGDHLINRACRNAISKNSCSYYTNYEQKIESMNVDTVNDIEDLCKFGHTHQCCPYYAAKKIAEVKASMVFMPYNYMLDPSVRKNLPLKLKNSIVIFDEAHNIQSALRDCVSASVRVSCLKTVVDSCLELPSKLATAMNQERFGLSRSGYDPQSKRGGIVDELSTSKKNNKPAKEPKISFMEELAEKLTTERIQQVRASADILKKELEADVTKSDYRPTDVFYKYLRTAGIEYSTSDMMITTLDSMASFWSTAGVMSPDKVARYLSAITNFSGLISLLYPESCFRLQLLDTHKEELMTHFKGYCKTLQDEGGPLDRGTKILDIELNIWCLNPAIGLKRIFNAESKPRTLIFTSGTLSPIESMTRALDFQPGSFLMESLAHVIGDNQMKMLVLDKSPSSYSLSAKYEDAEKPQYPVELGKTLQPLFEVLPFGTLVFFPSYVRMKKVIDNWKCRSTWNEMARRTKLFIESKGQEEFERDVDSYKRIINSEDNSGNRAVFFGVCRGKLSEGTNLAGNECRSVVIAGVPFPSTQDPRVKAMKTYRDLHKNPDGRMWFSEQMKQALYQTVGRAIRSRSDFGLLLLCDPRFAFCKQGAPVWMQKYYPNEPTHFDRLESEIKSFFQAHDISITGSVTQKMDAFELAAPQTKSTAAKQASLPVKSAAEKRSLEDRQRDMIASYSSGREAAKKLCLPAPSSEPDPPPLPAAEPIASLSGIDKIFQAAASSAPSTNTRYSILTRPPAINGPSKHKCYICKNPANNPYRTGCRCQHSGCKSCLSVLNGKICGGCKTRITVRDMKQLCFRSATFRREKLKEI